MFHLTLAIMREVNSSAFHTAWLTARLRQGPRGSLDSDAFALFLLLPQQ